MDDVQYMRLAIEQAQLAQQRGEVPVGAVIVLNETVIAKGHNRNLLDHDPTAHAEIVSLRKAAELTKNHRLNGCTMFVTIEPCAMCAGALVHARLARLVFGAFDPKAGAVQSVMQVLNHPALNHRMEVIPGVLADECSALVQGFFRERRASK